MNFAMRWLAGALVTLGLLIGTHDAVAAEPPAANAAAVADPATWGIYAQLVGTEWQGADGNAHWRWGPDNTIVESRTFQMKSVIRPGANRGELVSVYGGGLHSYDGRIAADGSVLWVRRGRFLRMSSRVAIADGKLIEEMVKLDDVGEVAKVGYTFRFDQTAGPKVVAVMVAPAVATSGTAAQTSAASPVAGPQAAGVAPALVLAPVPPATHLERLRPMLGMMFVGGDQTIEFPAGADADGFTLRYANYLDSNTTTFTYRTSGQPGVYTVTRQPADAYFTNFTGAVQADGTLVMSFQPINPDGYTYAYRYQMKGTGLLETRLALQKKWLRSEPEVTTQALNDYLPYSPAQYKAQADFAVMARQIMGSPEEQAAQRAREARQAKIESDQALGRAFNNMLGDLSEHAAREAQTRADADAMLARINAQAEAHRQAKAEAERQAQANAQQQAAEQQRQAQAGNARRVAEQQAARPVQQQASAPTQASQPPSSTSGANSSAATSPGAPLRFILHIPLKAVINGVNATCYSNIVTIPGPPGWPDTWNQPGGDNEARALIKAYMPAFESQCRAYGPLTGGGPNFHWNRKGSEHISPESVSAAGQRHGQPVVQL